MRIFRASYLFPLFKRWISLPNFQFQWNFLGKNYSSETYFSEVKLFLFPQAWCKIHVDMSILIYLSTFVLPTVITNLFPSVVNICTSNCHHKFISFSRKHEHEQVADEASDHHISAVMVWFARRNVFSRPDFRPPSPAPQVTENRKSVFIHPPPTWFQTAPLNYCQLSVLWYISHMVADELVQVLTFTVDFFRKSWL